VQSVDPQRAHGARLVVVGVEHQVIDDELVMRPEQVGQAHGAHLVVGVEVDRTFGEGIGGQHRPRGKRPPAGRHASTWSDSACSAATSAARAARYSSLAPVANNRGRSPSTWRVTLFSRSHHSKRPELAEALGPRAVQAARCR
jgi:hypothetical protein